MTAVRIDGFLRELGAPGRWDTGAADVGRMIDELETLFPRLKLKLRDESGQLRRFVRVFVNGEDVRNGQGLGTSLGPSDHVDILHSTQGG
jgi:molybdopterin synthase sulfur carrier subunit